MSSATFESPARRRMNPVAWVGYSVIESVGYAGGVTILMLSVAGSLFWSGPRSRDDDAPGFIKSLLHQLFWMLYMGIPLVGLVHIAIGSFLSLQAYYGSTFVDGTGAVVGVGLLRNLGGIMSGMVFAGIMAARMIPELYLLQGHHALLEEEAAEEASSASGVARQGRASSAAGRAAAPCWNPNTLVAPRVVAAGIAGILLCMWGITVGTVIGWKASESLMGLSTEMFFMMMLKMMWFRDVLGLVAKGILFGALPAAICCYEGLFRATCAEQRRRAERSGAPPRALVELTPPFSGAVFRAACLSMVAILVMNASWFMLVYHAVPFYGPTLLPQP
jgi:phospholipid/cholesterol/gamma-HCH transport system permease protein